MERVIYCLFVDWTRTMLEGQISARVSERAGGASVPAESAQPKQMMRVAMRCDGRKAKGGDGNTVISLGPQNHPREWKGDGKEV